MRSVLREEKKYLIGSMEKSCLDSRLSEVMMPDPHNGPVGYVVRSLYFDTPFDKDFNEKNDGVELRRKIRLRVYGPEDDHAMLEIKQKEGQYQKKRSLQITREDALALIDGQKGVLLNYPEDFAAECFVLMSMGCYVPKTIVEYDRKAFIAKENNIRITLDGGIRATESCFDLFSDHLVMNSVFPVTDTVLEVKYNGFLLSYVKQAVGAVHKSELSVSKYSLARTTTMN